MRTNLPLTQHEFDYRTRCAESSADALPFYLESGDVHNTIQTLGQTAAAQGIKTDALGLARSVQVFHLA